MQAWACMGMHVRARTHARRRRAWVYYRCARGNVHACTEATARVCMHGGDLRSVGAPRRKRAFSS